VAVHWKQIDGNWGKGLAAFGIGALGGATAAATGGAVLGAFGTAAGAGGFVGGAIAGGVGYSFGMTTTSLGNNMAFGDPMPTGKQFLMGLGVSMLTGGVINGTVSAADGGNFWTGPKTPQPTVPTPAQTTTTQETTQNTGIQPQTQPKTSQAQQLEQNRAIGRIAEDVSGINQANKVRIPSATETANYRIPDELTSTTLREIKNVSYLDYTPQLRDFVAYSQQNNLQMQLWIRPNFTIYGPGTTISPQLQNVINKGFIRIFTIPF
jgi:hypothetical protein